ncbi:hypothetical protein [Psychrosphaera aestuarii]|uniref:hypothetical protein n=1 Tax=Psychrosphaera aestuarii TaxID=1266052 RepID=UPI001B327571|nr:hypothetical protein [Psychrosphaera aestuarii]
MNKSLVGVIIAFAVAVAVVYLWEVKVNDFSTKNYEPKYTQCENVYVRKSPHPCNAGDLIYIDADVADKYCTDNIIARFEDSVYCQYNGFREDLAEITTLDY